MPSVSPTFWFNSNSLFTSGSLLAVSTLGVETPESDGFGDVNWEFQHFRPVRSRTPDSAT